MDCALYIFTERTLVRATPRLYHFNFKKVVYLIKSNNSFLRIWSHLLKKSVMENLIFCAVLIPNQKSYDIDNWDPTRSASVIIKLEDEKPIIQNLTI